ncbi:hypothetical protein IC582_026656 [Cucumis melo]
MGRQPTGGSPATTIVRHPSWNYIGYRGCEFVEARASRCKTDSGFHIVVRQFSI